MIFLSKQTHFFDMKLLELKNKQSNNLTKNTSSWPKKKILNINKKRL